MAAASSTITIVLDAVDNASAKINQAVGGIKGAISSISQSMKNWVDENKIASAAIGLGMGKIAKDMISSAAEFERVGVMTRYLTKSTEEANKFSQAIIDIAVNTPFSTKEITTFSAQLLGQTRDVDLSVRALNALTNATSAMGGEYDELRGITRAWIQTFIKATPSLEELNRQMANANIPGLRVLAEQIANGTVKLKGYTDAVNTAGGASKAVTKAFQSASDQLPILAKRSEAAEMKLKTLKDAGKENTAAFKSAEASVMSYHQKLDKAQGSIASYNTAISTGSQKASSGFKKSVEEIMSDFQKVSELGVTGKDFAIAMMEALEIEYAGANEAMLSSFSGTVENIKDIMGVLQASILGIDKNLQVRKGSIFYYLKQGAENLANFLQAHREDIANFVDGILKSKPALIGIAAVLMTLLAPAFLFTLGLFAPFIAQALLIGGAFFVIGNAALLVIDQMGGIDVVIQRIKPVFDNFVSTIKTFGTNIATGFSQGLDAVKEKLAGLRGMESPVPPTWTDAFQGLKQALETVWNFLVTIFTPAWDNLKIAFNVFMIAMQPVIEQIKKIIPPLMQIIGVIAIVAAAILTGLLTAFTGALQGIGLIIAGIIQIVTSLIEIIVGIVTLDGQMIVEGFKGIFGGIINIVAGFIGTVYGAIKGFIDGIIAFFKGLYNALIGGSIIPDLVNGIINWFVSLKDKVMGIVTGLIDAISGAFSGLVSSALNWGKNMIGNLISGIKSGILGAGKLAGKLAGEIGMSIEELKRMQHGGIVPGPIGAPMPIIAHGGERITPQGGVDVNERTLGGMSGGGASGVTVNINGNVTLDNEERVRQLANMIMRMLGRESELSRYGVGYSFV